MAFFNNFWQDAAEVGLFLFLRAISNRFDSRFDSVRTNRLLFAAVFVMQGVWATVCSLPVATLTALPLEVFDELPGGIVSWVWDIGAAYCYVFGTWLEITADLQKYRWSFEKRQQNGRKYHYLIELGKLYLPTAVSPPRDLLRFAAMARKKTARKASTRNSKNPAQGVAPPTGKTQPITTAEASDDEMEDDEMEDDEMEDGDELGGEDGNGINPLHDESDETLAGIIVRLAEEPNDMVAQLAADEMMTRLRRLRQKVQNGKRGEGDDEGMDTATLHQTLVNTVAEAVGQGVEKAVEEVRKEMQEVQKELQEVRRELQA
ncbi:hypothetical protein N0V88_007673 [Collariella sp. IMI 366227]|nr:hypothetical protein N0V88_007673 [Collariella sp. IMI 366227]